MTVKESHNVGQGLANISRVHCLSSRAQVEASLVGKLPCLIWPDPSSTFSLLAEKYHRTEDLIPEPEIEYMHGQLVQEIIRVDHMSTRIIQMQLY